MGTFEIIQLAQSFKMLANREMQSDYYPLENATVEAEYNENNEVVDVYVRTTNDVVYARSFNVNCLEGEIARTIDEVKRILA
jgi:hypothetical protein